MARHQRTDIIAPTTYDPVLKFLNAERIGPSGERRSRGAKTGFFTPFRVLILFTTLAALIAALLKTPCRLNGWGLPGAYFGGCYSDWSALYSARGFAENPWAAFADGSTFEYPVVISAIASVFAAITQLIPGSDTHGSLVFFDVNFFAVVALWFVTVVVTARSAGRRLWDAAMLALAPGIMFAGFINWDMWAVAFLALAMWTFAGKRYVAAGVFLGLGIAAKIYPLFLLGAILVIALRTRNFRPLLITALSTALTWLAVNLPLILMNYEAWKLFYEFSSERAPSWSSVWHVWNILSPDRFHIDGQLLSGLAFWGFFIACVGVLIIGMTAPVTPRLAQLMFLLVAAFTVLNKVYSPQFVLWLIPLFVLAIPNWRDFLIWQSIEVAHFWVIWAHLAAVMEAHEPQHLIDESIYVMAVLAHTLVVVYLMVRVIIQIYRPHTDMVRILHYGKDPLYGEEQAAKQH